ncbi:cell division protein [Streptococcus pyogenes]|nr:cell division protein [Streptococcus pyogenes]
MIAEALLKYETLDAAQIKSIYETGKMPVDLETDDNEAHALSYDEIKNKMTESESAE